LNSLPWHICGLSLQPRNLEKKAASLKPDMFIEKKNWLKPIGIL